MDEYEVREVLKKSSYPFLAAYNNEWIDSDGKELSFDDMGRTYLKNCYKMLQEQKYGIEHGFFLEGVKYDEAKYEEIVETTKRLYYAKTDELKNYLKL